jgi:hypothetical protein
VGKTSIACATAILTREHFKTKRGLRSLLLNFRILFGLHSRIPANEGLSELVIEHLCPHLEEIVRAGLAPSHLLFLHHALAYHLIHRGLREGR